MSQLKQNNIIVASNRKTTNDFFKKYIAQLGKIICVSTIESVIGKIYENRDISVIIVDEEVSLSSGASLVSFLKSVPPFRNIPMILLSSTDGKKQHDNDCGADSYLVWPCSNEKLSAEISNIMMCEDAVITAK
jgi:response regulator RpfG family c-di-GMP phosphodiesterase